MKFDKVYNLFTERVIFGRQGKMLYSVPDNFDEVYDKPLTDTIEGDSRGSNIIMSDYTTHKEVQDEKTKKLKRVEPNAKEVWDWLGSTKVGKDLLSTYPAAANYRISGEKARNVGDGKDFEEYDLWANRGQRESDQTMPSFREYNNNPEKYNQRQISGGSTKQTPLV